MKINTFAAAMALLLTSADLVLAKPIWLSQGSYEQFCNQVGPLFPPSGLGVCFDVGIGGVDSIVDDGSTFSGYVSDDRTSFAIKLVDDTAHVVSPLWTLDLSTTPSKPGCVLVSAHEVNFYKDRDEYLCRVVCDAKTQHVQLSKPFADADVNLSPCTFG